MLVQKLKGGILSWYGKAWKPRKDIDLEAARKEFIRLMKLV